MYLRISSWITTRTARCRSRFGHRAAIACSELVLALTATQPHAATLPRQQRPFANCPLSRPRSVPRNAVTDNSRPTLPIPAHRRGRPRTQTFGTGAAYLTPRVVARGGPRPSADRPPPDHTDRPGYTTVQIRSNNYLRYSVKNAKNVTNPSCFCSERCVHWIFEPRVCIVYEYACINILLYKATMNCLGLHHLHNVAVQWD